MVFGMLGSIHHMCVPVTTRLQNSFEGSLGVLCLAEPLRTHARGANLGGLTAQMNAHPSFGLHPNQPCPLDGDCNCKGQCLGRFATNARQDIQSVRVKPTLGMSALQVLSAHWSQVLVALPQYVSTEKS